MSSARRRDHRSRRRPSQPNRPTVGRPPRKSWCIQRCRPPRPSACWLERPLNAISSIDIAGIVTEAQFCLGIDIAMQKPVVTRPAPHAMEDVCHLVLGSQCFGIPGLSSRFLALKPHSAKTAPDLGLDRDRSDDLVYMFAICVWGLVALAGSWVGHQSGLALWACSFPRQPRVPCGCCTPFRRSHISDQKCTRSGLAHSSRLVASPDSEGTTPSTNK